VFKCDRHWQSARIYNDLFHGGYGTAMSNFSPDRRTILDYNGYHRDSVGVVPDKSPRGRKGKKVEIRATSLIMWSGAEDARVWYNSIDESHAAQGLRKRRLPVR